jgi:hypothetical protein
VGKLLNRGFTKHAVTEQTMNSSVLATPHPTFPHPVADWVHQIIKDTSAGLLEL